LFRGVSFAEIVKGLKGEGFEILAGVDSEEVSALVTRVEAAKQSGEWK
jgi:hypothetical protein